MENMVEVLGTNIDIGSLSMGSSTTWIIIGTLIVVFITAFIVIWLIYRSRIYNKKIIVFENIAGQGFQPVYRDKARLIRAGDGGEELLYLRKKKLYRTAYGKKMGKNTYWFAIGQDGYWYNSILGDLDAKMGMLDIEPIDRDMRYMNVAIRKAIQNRYRKQSFMEKYGTHLMNGIFLVIMIIGVVFIIDKTGDLIGVLNQGLDASRQTAEVNRQVLASLDNICGGGSGIIPV